MHFTVQGILLLSYGRKNKIANVKELVCTATLNKADNYKKEDLLIL